MNTPYIADGVFQRPELALEMAVAEAGPALTKTRSIPYLPIPWRHRAIRLLGSVFHLPEVLEVVERVFPATPAFVRVEALDVVHYFEEALLVVVDALLHPRDDLIEEEVDLLPFDDELIAERCQEFLYRADSLHAPYVLIGSVVIILETRHMTVHTASVTIRTERIHQAIP